MRRLDELHLEHPFAGARMLRDLLRAEGHAKIGRRHVGTLMERMGIEALYRKPNTSRKKAGEQVYPYLLRELAIDRPNQVSGVRQLNPKKPHFSHETPVSTRRGSTVKPQKTAFFPRDPSIHAG
jgi:hypothetical protein